jgi:teichuronic acid biosynthesis glycosyltransferase TuaC
MPSNNDISHPMRVLVLAKRFYTGKDMLIDRYGRVYEFSRVLASLGHSVYGVVLDYRMSGDDGGGRCIQDGKLTWETGKLFPNPFSGILAYLDRITSAVSRFTPDTVLSVSDVFHVVLGDWLAAKYGLRHVVDLYDNYESFSAARIPGLISLFRRALRRADGIVCVSQPLATYVRDQCRLQTTPQIIRNAVDTKRFLPRDRTDCRRTLHLPEGKILVGYGGAIAGSRGINVVFQAHRELKAGNPDIHLVLAGPVDKYTEIPNNKDVHYLGELEYTNMPEFFSALDVGIVSNRDSSFGRYCFPQKFFEMLACDTPVVTASTGEMTDLMEGCAHAVFQPEVIKDLVRAVLKQLDTPCKPTIDIPCWFRQGKVLSDYLESVAR